MTTETRKDVFYSDMLVRDHIKFQYPPNTLLIIKYISERGLDSAAVFTLVTRIFLGTAGISSARTLRLSPA